MLLAVSLVLAVVALASVWFRRRLGGAIRHLVTGVGVAAAVLVVAIAGLWLWALTATGESQLARSVAWGESDTGDIDRFTARPIDPSSKPAPFALEPSDLVAAYRDPGSDTPLVDTLADRDTTAFLVIVDGRLIHEQYLNGADAQTPHTSFSMAKSYVATLIAIAEAEGHIDSLDVPITDHLPELAERDARFADITIRDLLAMASGLDFDDGWTPWDDPANTYYGTDLRAAALEQTEVTAAPGAWQYNDWNTILLGLILERATGTRPADYLQTRLWDPIGAEGPASWSLDSDASGFEQSFVGVNALPIDFAKLGVLYLNEGMGPDGRIVSEAFVRDATAVDTAVNGVDQYQLQWWVDGANDGFYAAGNHCQFVYVHRPSRTVVTRVGSGCGDVDWPEVMADLAIWLAEESSGQ